MHEELKGALRIERMAGLPRWFAVIDCSQRYGVAFSVRWEWLAKLASWAMGPTFDYQEWGA